MKGMEHLLKSMGFDAEEIKAQITQFGALIYDLHAVQMRIEKNQVLIMRALLEAPEIDTSAIAERLQSYDERGHYSDPGGSPAARNGS